MFKIDRIQIDQFFVTPLVATQFINLLLETALPALLQKVRRSASTMVHKRTTVAARMAESVRVFMGKSAFELPLLARSDDSNAHLGAELLLEANIGPYETFNDYMGDDPLITIYGRVTLDSAPL